MTYYFTPAMYERALRILGTYWTVFGGFASSETRAEAMAEYSARGRYNVMHDGVIP